MTKVFIDGASNPVKKRSGIGIVWFNAEMVPFSATAKEIFSKKKWPTNNEAEYEALYHCLLEAKEKNITTFHIYSDSMLVVKQVQGLWKVKKPHLQKKKDKIINLQMPFSISHVKRELNTWADYYSKKAIGAIKFNKKYELSI